MILAVLFDLDGTLLDRETSVRNCIQDQFARFSDRLGSVSMGEFLALFGTLDQRGYVPKTVVYERMRAELGFSLPLSRALTDDYFLSYPRFCAGFRNMAQTLKTLRDRGIKLAIVTNASVSFQTSAIQALRIEHMFDAIVISEAEGVRKPDRRIFDLTLARLGVAPADAVFEGDHPEIDIRGAQGAGMRAIWKRGDYWGACTFANAVIEELEELPGVLDRVAMEIRSPLDRVP
jgi:putative hydrolase of the HAD superfamily